jgi:hypothetical protein
MLCSFENAPQSIVGSPPLCLKRSMGAGRRQPRASGILDILLVPVEGLGRTEKWTWRRGRDLRALPEQGSSFSRVHPGIRVARLAIPSSKTFRPPSSLRPKGAQTLSDAINLNSRLTLRALRGSIWASVASSRGRVPRNA